MPTSSRMLWPYPKEFTEYWFEKIKSFINAVDASVFTTREDKNFILFGGGTVTFDATTGVLAWSEALQAVSAVTGLHWYIPSSTSGGSVTLQDGELLYVELTRAPTTSQSIAEASGSRISVSDDAVVLAQRYGSVVIWRSGAVIGSGQSVVLFGPRVFTTVADTVGLAGLQETDQVTWQDKGGFRYDPAAYFPGGGGITRQIKLYAMLRTTDAATPLPAQVRLYNLTDTVVVTGTELSSSSLTWGMVSSPVLTPGTGGFSAGVADYLIQLQIDDTSGSPTPSDRAYCLQAYLQTTWIG